MQLGNITLVSGIAEHTNAFREVTPAGQESTSTESHAETNHFKSHP